MPQRPKAQISAIAAELGTRLATISEVAKRLDRTPEAVRYLDGELKPYRLASTRGLRLYSWPQVELVAARLDFIAGKRAGLGHRRPGPRPRSAAR